MPSSRRLVPPGLLASQSLPLPPRGGPLQDLPSPSLPAWPSLRFLFLRGHHQWDEHQPNL